MAHPYERPSAPASAEHLVKKSRFVASAAPARDRAAAMTFIQECAAEHPDARHVCYGFIAGNPYEQPEMGSSDDGEPAGTAGRPILGVLDHSGLGDVVAVVVRYFGGVKLGAGGLVRAYSTAAQQAVERLPRQTWEPTRRLHLSFDFALESRVRRLADEHGASLGDPQYGGRVSLEAKARASAVDGFTRALVEATQGRIEIEADPD